MKRIRMVALLCAIAAFGFIGCKSAEPEPEPTIEEPVIEEPTVQEPEPEPEAPDYSESNAALLAKLEAARQNAVDADAKYYYPALFDDAETTDAQLKNDVDTNPATDYAADINDLIARYEALAKASEAQRMKKRADDMDFSEYDKLAYDAGASALTKFEQDDLGAAQLLDATAAYESYKLLLNKGFAALAGKERNAALEAKKLADSVKAGVSQKDAYGEAADAFKKADSAYVTKDIETAYESYKASKETYNGLYEKVSAARAAAQAAIERAKQRVVDSESYATDADEIAPLTETVRGIEDENAVLLEADDLANPDDAVIDVNEGTTAQAAETAAAAAIAAEESFDNTVNAGANFLNSALNGDAK